MQLESFLGFIVQNLGGCDSARVDIDLEVLLLVSFLNGVEDVSVGFVNVSCFDAGNKGSSGNVLDNNKKYGKTRRKRINFLPGAI